MNEPVFYGCFNWMIPNLYIKSTKHPLKNGCLVYQEHDKSAYPFAGRTASSGCLGSMVYHMVFSTELQFFLRKFLCLGTFCVPRMSGGAIFEDCFTSDLSIILMTETTDSFNSLQISRKFQWDTSFETARNGRFCFEVV